MAVNDVGIAFLRAARERGDGFGPLSWRHEIAHPVGSPVGGRRNEQVIADAVLVYEHYEDGVWFKYRFLEFDRNTMPVHALGKKLARYGRLSEYRVPSKKTTMSQGPRFWATRYRVFPDVLLVFDNGTPEQLRRRRDLVLWFASTESELRDAADVNVTACLLSELQAEGPFAPIFRTQREREQPVDWLGRGEDDEKNEDGEKDGDGE